MPPAKPTPPKPKTSFIIRNIYLYLVAIIGLVTFIVGAVGIIDNVLQNYVFQVNDYVRYDAYIWGSPELAPCSASYTDANDKIITRTTSEINTCKENITKQQERDHQNSIGRQFSSSISAIVIGLPLWLFHWMIIQNEDKKRKKQAL